jgi:S1-C subfamily serine protease
MSEYQGYQGSGWGPDVPQSPQPQVPPGGMWPAPPRRRRRLPAMLAALALVLLAGLGLVAWQLGRSPGHASFTSLFSHSQASDPESGLVDVDTVVGYQGGQAAGTGVVLTSNGEVLTNNHVVQGATEIQVTDIGNGQTYPAKVVGYDRSQDIAVLQLQGASGLQTAALGDSSTVAVGDAITGIGNAGGKGGTPSKAPGTVTALDQTITASDENGANAEQLTNLIQVNANIQPGDSGGALVNNSGQVIGMNTAASTQFHLNRRGGGGASGATQGFAIPINKAVTVAQQIESGSGTSTVHIGESAMLGVSVTDTDQGAGIGQVLSGSPAVQAGLAAGDVITAMDGKTIDSSTALSTVIDQHHPGDTVSITWVDQSQQQHTGNAKLATGPVG